MKIIGKIMTSFLLAVLVTCSFSSLAQEKSSADRNLSSFNSVAVSGAMDVFLTEGDTEKARIEAEGIEIDEITTEVNGDELKIGIKNKNGMWSWNSKMKVKVYVTYRQLKAVKSSGSSDIFCKSTLKADEFSINISGSGDLSGDMDVKTLSVSVSGSADVKVGGKAETQDVVISGSGDFKGEDLKGKYVKVKISGSGDAKVWAEESIEARVSGSGDVVYKGNPSKEVSKVSGSGTIRKG
jgi:hypothetical protein